MSAGAVAPGGHPSRRLLVTVCAASHRASALRAWVPVGSTPVVGFGLYGVSLSLLPASVANLVLTLEPALTALVAWAWLGERLGPAEIAGAGIILLGVAVLRIGEWSGEGASAAGGGARPEPDASAVAARLDTAVAWTAARDHGPAGSERIPPGLSKVHQERSCK